MQMYCISSKLSQVVSVTRTAGTTASGGRVVGSGTAYLGPRVPVPPVALLSCAVDLEPIIHPV